jgi:hypothetical protein
MTRADVTILRRQACATIAALGPILDALQTIDETLENPAPAGSADVDALLVVGRLKEAVEASEQFNDAAGTFTQYLIAHNIAAQEHAAELLQKAAS